MAVRTEILLILGAMTQRTVHPLLIRKNIPELDMMNLRYGHLDHEPTDLVKEGLLRDCEMHLLSSPLQC